MFMNKIEREVSFDEVMLSWLEAEIKQIEGRDILPVAKDKGFSSITEWRLATALRLGMDKKVWHLVEIEDPNTVLPKIIVGPYQGWSRFFDNKIDTTFEQALEIPEFFEWCKTHDRIQPIIENYPTSSTIILYRKTNGELIHIEGGHRICAVMYQEKIGETINFDGIKITAAVADIDESEVAKLQEFLKVGTYKQ